MPQTFKDLEPCIVCGKKLETVRDDNGKVIMMGIHPKCAEEYIKMREEQQAKGPEDN